MNQLLISIIVPCYNQAQYLDECLQSVLDQTFQDWECIIINDGSPDNTEEVAVKWVEKDLRFKYLSQINKGVSAARNLGIEKAEGRYIQFLDGDDILQCFKLEYQFEILERIDKIDIVYGGSRYFVGDNSKNFCAVHPIGIIPSIDLQYSDENQLDVLLIRNVSTICATLYRKEIFQKIKFKDTVYEDYLVHIEMAFENFNFHFCRADEGNCLIRITKDSQMIKHLEDKNSNTIFIEEVKKIKSIYHSTFSNIIFRSNTLSFKEKVALFIPPVFFLIKNKLNAKK